MVLVEGHGVEGDAHAGATVQHRSRKRWRPSEPNLRQVHLLHEELLDDLRGRGFEVAPGDVGENVLVRGLDLLAGPLFHRRLVSGGTIDARFAERVVDVALAGMSGRG